MCDSESAQIANIFTQGQFAIHMQTGQRLILTELFDELGNARIEFLTVSVGPPVHAIALGIELTALVIITMYYFMTDDRADAAVIQRIVRLRVEERRLQDGGRGVDRIVGWGVVSIDDLRRHEPFFPVTRLADS